MPLTATRGAAPGDLQEQWSILYSEQLPRLAKARDRVQSKWPVSLDHCFARIILDNAIGKDAPWTNRLPQPAIKNMSAAQLHAAIDLGHKIATGAANLDDLNKHSLELRGRKSSRDGPHPKKKRSNEPEEDQEGKRSSPAAKRPKRKPSPQQDIRSHFSSDRPKITILPSKPSPPAAPAPELLQARETVMSSSDLTPFRRFVLILLTYVPRGRHTTYGAMSAHITAHHHKCSARAIGNAMRNNPFAPLVPCHRVLAHDGRIGGFGGDWGEQGKHSKEKKRLLAEEGVIFDGRGKVVGKPYTDFHEDNEVQSWYERILGSRQK